MPRRDFVSPDRIEKGELWGSGGFGLVYEGRVHLKTGEWVKVALKVLAPQLDRDARARKQYANEVQATLETARWCKHVVQCIGWTKLGPQQSLCLIMKFYEHGTLQDLLRKNPATGLARESDDPGDRLPLPLIVRIAMDVAQGLAELHEGRMANEDLKPGNVLLDSDYHAVLSDFGLSKFFGGLGTEQLSTQHVRGTSPFLPPEKLRSSDPRLTYDLAVDMWAFGILLGQMVTVDLLYPYGPGVTWENVRNQLVYDREAPEPPPIPEAPRLQQLIRACLQLDPARRITAPRAVQELWSIQEELHGAAGSNQGDPARTPKLRTGTIFSATLAGHKKSVCSVAFTPDGATLVSGSDDKTVKLWDVASGCCTATLEGHRSYVLCVAVSGDGRTAASGCGQLFSSDKSVKLWRLSSQRCTATLTGHTDWVRCVAFSPDGSTIASGSHLSDKTIKLWSASTGNHMATLKGHSDTVCAVAFSRDGTRLASGSDDYTVGLWDLRGGAQLCMLLKGHTKYVMSVVFRPNGAHVLSGSCDKTIRVWDATTGACTRTLIGHGFDVNSVALTPDGALAVSGSYGETIKIWDWKGSGACLATLEGHTDSVRSVAVSPDGRTVASGSDDRTIKLWRIAD
ncbi:WD40-repeat-containing domain protein [Dunaliella salina]|uniref:WD40-repeat-containing domain protein n=1 Tax=Dunaliella salina TaxID=3046 RepID=A0ABQ7G8B3_DUNSA|nr:WD40-repeat-containing domain protein [Dunaliella salina]|eukprot:KAF5830847.1 WD40-repeat-containing domain protein [Dunaliella salina]